MVKVITFELIAITGEVCRPDSGLQIIFLFWLQKISIKNLLFWNTYGWNGFIDLAIVSIWTGFLFQNQFPSASLTFHLHFGYNHTGNRNLWNSRCL